MKSIVSEYHEHAEHAANLEQQGSYKAAGFAWQVASHFARNGNNSHWANARSEFCQRWLNRYGSIGDLQCK